MSKTKSNVHPGHYKVAGRGRQGEDVIHDRQKAKVAASHAMQEHQAPYPERRPVAEDGVVTAGAAVTTASGDRLESVRAPSLGKARASRKAKKPTVAAGPARARKAGARARRPVAKRR